MPVTLPIYQVDAFADHAFEGNPAAVVPLTTWLSEATLQAIAEENNLSETAFFVREGGRYRIRWFTPLAEVKLCGHATLAAAHVLFHHMGLATDSVAFDSPSGPLSVKRDDDRLTLDFPSQPPTFCDVPPDLVQGLGVAPTACLVHADYLAVYDSEDRVAAIEPHTDALARLAHRGVIVTAPAQASDVEFVARFFAPKLGIAEDPVTGSAYTQLTPYWASRLGRSALEARQLSRRGGRLAVADEGDRVLISGGAVTYLEGTVTIDREV